MSRGISRIHIKEVVTSRTTLEVKRMSGGVRVLLYLLSFFIPVAGIVLGIVWMNDSDTEKKKIGKTCLIISIVAIVLSCVCWFAASALSIMPVFYGY